ncbi:multicopper oxidase domain-containing protein [Kitasatospora sp. NPDC059673]|uniref:multicopper oxidase domain-containing protein n=1 Tax=Kitasatospora sp. NPDC059673 TaxID=3346901 RepID=UPI00368A952F
MATLEYWIQLENRPWDASPNGRDRMTGQTLEAITGKAPVPVLLTSPGTGVSATRTMHNPLRDSNGDVKDALILRRYKPPAKADGSDAWTVPDDRKVNPWDLNEPDPTDAGTMGTIPGPVIECEVGDTVLVHFRNMDMRSMGQMPLPIEKRVHSLHTHGFAFERAQDGAYPLSPPDPGQAVPPSEASAWAGVPGFSGSLKQGDRVPPGGTFTYRWETFGWPTTAGVWLYHDHSICDMENVELGAIGIVVIHNPADDQHEVDIRLPGDPTSPDPALLPGGSPNGSPVASSCLPLGDLPVLPHHLAGLGAPAAPGRQGNGHEPAPEAEHIERDRGRGPKVERVTRVGGLSLELDEDLRRASGICLPVYQQPPSKALYLQLFHALNGAVGMTVNGRSFLGNTPTMIAGRDTRMRFGVVGMGSDTHTFHIHGHRWTVLGPDGADPGTIQSSPEVAAVSQFEDTRVFGAANSMAFTIDGATGSFMRAGGPGEDQSIGEWHMHCHVLAHMMTGMMGSLLIIRGGELALGLPEGVPCAMDGGHNGGHNGGAQTHEVVMQNAQYVPSSMSIHVGDQVRFVNQDGFEHSVDWDTAGAPPNSPVIVGQGQPGDTYTTPPMASAGTFAFHCRFHGAPGSGMNGSITVA